MAKIAVIGSGFSGLSAAAYLSAANHDVHVFEKNDTIGGRARQLRSENGYVFDMGPSWYWMPDVFEKFFADFGHRVEDFYKLELLDPSFDIVFPDGTISIPQKFSELILLFEAIEKGSGQRLEKFMREAEFKYRIAMDKIVYMPGISFSEFADTNLLRRLGRMQIFSSLGKHVRNYFSDPRLIALMEFPVLFLGAEPQHTPALYSMMNYAGLQLGTWYPKRGFGAVVNAIAEVAEENGAQFHLNSPVQKIIVNDRITTGVAVNGQEIYFDAVLAAADYHYVENKLLPPSHRNYKEDYWESRTLAPSCLIYYIGITKKIKLIRHHTLFFDEDLAQHGKEIYSSPQWPTRPLFYVSCTSKSDEYVAPVGHENLFLLMPIAPGIEDSELLREKYYSIMMDRLQKYVGEDINNYIDYKKSYCIKDFISDYHSYKGNAYGLANTLRQTALLKPKIRNRKIDNLFYAGQLTVPGPGVPPSLISGKIASQLLIKHLQTQRHEAII